MLQLTTREPGGTEQGSDFHQDQQTQGVGLQLSHLQGDCSHSDPGRNHEHTVYMCLACAEVNEMQAQDEGLTDLLSEIHLHI